VKLKLAWCFALWLTACAAQGAVKPNILIILADEMGYSDILRHES